MREYLYKNLVRSAGMMIGSVPTDVDSMHGLALTMAQTIFNDRKQVNTTWLITGKFPGIAVIESIWNGDDQKDDVIAYFRSIFKRLETSLYSFMDEAWMLDLPINADITKIVRPSENPDRKEILIIETYSKKEYRSTTFDIKRPGPELINRHDAPKNIISAGRLHNLLEERGTTH